MIGILLAVLMFSFSGCSGKEETLAERSIDGVAAYLGYFDGEELSDLSARGKIFGAENRSAPF